MAHLGVELRDVRSALREVEKLEGGQESYSKISAALLLPPSLSLSPGEILPIHELTAESHKAPH